MAEKLNGKCRSLLELSLAAIAGDMERRVRESRCESEIERILFSAFLAAHYGRMLMPAVFYTYEILDHWHGHASLDAIKNTYFETGTVHVIPQCVIGEYRVDFLLTVQNYIDLDRRVLLAVECDGHDFHEKTKEQAARDKKRDRDLLSMGVSTVRFTGSEVWRDPLACIRQIENCLMSAVERMGARSA